MFLYALPPFEVNELYCISICLNLWTRLAGGILFYFRYTEHETSKFTFPWHQRITSLSIFFIITPQCYQKHGVAWISFHCSCECLLSLHKLHFQILLVTLNLTPHDTNKGHRKQAETTTGIYQNVPSMESKKSYIAEPTIEVPLNPVTSPFLPINRPFKKNIKAKSILCGQDTQHKLPLAVSERKITEFWEWLPDMWGDKGKLQTHRVPVSSSVPLRRVRGATGGTGRAAFGRSCTAEPRSRRAAVSQQSIGTAQKVIHKRAIIYVLVRRVSWGLDYKQKASHLFQAAAHAVPASLHGARDSARCDSQRGS